MANDPQGDLNVCHPTRRVVVKVLHEGWSSKSRYLEASPSGEQGKKAKTSMKLRVMPILDLWQMSTPNGLFVESMWDLRMRVGRISGERNASLAAEVESLRTSNVWPETVKY